MLFRSAEATYAAQGLMNTTSNLVVSTRIPVVTTTQVSDNRVLTSTTQSSTSATVQPTPPAPPPVETGTSTVPVDWSNSWIGVNNWADFLRDHGVRYMDPLAQTFLVDTQGGIVLTSMDLFFKEKDDNLPVTLDIRAEIGRAHV